MFQLFKNIFLYPIIELEALNIALIHLLLVAVFFLATKILLKYIKRFFNKLDLADKRLSVDGKDIPVWFLIRQVAWFIFVLISFRTLEVNNPELNLSGFLGIEFFRFKGFHIAIYHLFVVIIIYFVGRIGLNLLSIYLLRRIRKKDNVGQGTEYVYLQLSKYVVICIGTIIFMRTLGLDLELFLTATAFLLVGLGLGLQDVFKDFFSGLLLLFEGSVKVGDIIEMDRFDGTDNFVAKVEEINLRTSKVKTREGKLLIVPNSHLTFQKVHNWDIEDEYTRFNITVAVMFGQDLEIVKKVLRDAAVSHPMVSKNHDVIVRLLNFGDNGLELDVVFWSKRSLFIEIHRSDIRFEIDRKFREHTIEYPYPQMDIHHAPKEK
jgi:small-conductance mechanosensitive channel